MIYCRCSHLYQTVEERSTKEECEEEIKQVCEEKIVYHQPVYHPPPDLLQHHPYPPPPTPEPIFVTTPHPYAGPIPQPRDVTITPRGAGHLDRSRRRRRRETNPESQPGPQLSMFNLMFKSGGSGGGGGGDGGDKVRNILQQRTEPVLGGTVDLLPINEGGARLSQQFPGRLRVLSGTGEEQKTAQLALEKEGPFSNILSVSLDHHNSGMEY